ncbi:SGNH hydrolase domain-containing protein [Paractinoplanes brasiliensis]|uniref:SGNH domain-containing protein n=1 Tax=Paractinoplanes brasiliensis TaxID=52695 RepID=A0A4R6JSN7_9ACTN|nr:SGNH hydrolase domain-containing protein [Actinoplanes brasiliensis]TDO39723.1 hypothetical protein C8E87_3421 [Actinoplanes brasiliensis]GID28940.1 hypothetical protein Abr02nite_39230 [Actinoplanes brasiliensis]
MPSSLEFTRTFRLALLVALLSVLAGCTVAVPPPPRVEPTPPAPRIALSEVLAAVAKAPARRELPADLTPSLATTAEDIGFDNEKCEAGPTADSVEACVFGDRASAVDVVLYGDSHAGMWLPALTQIADRRHWRLWFYGKPGCPAVAMTIWNQPEQRVFDECSRFRDFVERQITTVRPELVIVTNESFSQKRDNGRLITPGEWTDGLTRTLRTVGRSAADVVVLGNTPVLDESAPECLAAHQTNISRCFTTRKAATARTWNEADEAAARKTGSGYISVLPWLCTAMCSPVIGNVTVYRNRFHLTGTYARMVNGVLEDELLKRFPSNAVP